MLKNAPSFAQFALNGIWEEALSFEGNTPPSTEELKEYLADGNEVAFELFSGSLFFGIRFTGTPALVLELSEHCLTCLNKGLDLPSFIAAVGSHDVCGDLCREMDYVEVGAVNGWKSVGSYRLPAPAQALDQIDTLWSEIIATELAKDTNHPKAVELAYSDPLPHWLGLPISCQQPPYSLSKEMLREVLLKFTTNSG